MNHQRYDCSVLARPAFWVALVLGSISFSPSLMASQTAGEAVKVAQDHQQLIEAWRASRHERLKKPDGWLSLTGLEWLKEGKSRIGSSADNDIRLSGGPSQWGSVTLQNDRLYFENSDPENVKIDGEPLGHVELIPDTVGEATVVTSGTLSFNVIFRESYALRIKDSQAKTLLNFKGVDNYPIDESWRIEGRFTAATEGSDIEIINVLGQVSALTVFGTFEFDRDGASHNLIALGDSDSENLWFIFADRTSGHGTYGAGRYLYSDEMPEAGRLTVDFNKAYNPPCAFNEYSTCPIPPQQNRLDLFVEAGEKVFHPDPG